MTAIFILLAVAMTLIALVFIIVPLLRRTNAVSEHEDVRLRAVYRGQLEELDRELAQERLNESAYAAARQELSVRLESELSGPQTQKVGRSVVIGWLAALAIPLGALAIYASVGSFNILSDQPAAPALTERDDVPPEVMEMVQSLAARLENEPNDTAGWQMLGRSYGVLREYELAAQAYEQAVNRSPEPGSELLSNYAEMLVASTQGEFSGAVRIILNQALAQDSENPKALWLAGQGAAVNDQAEQAIGYYQRLLALNPPEEVQNILRREIADLGGEVEAAAGTENAATGVTLTVNVSLAKNLKADAQQALFVFARIPNGPPMPLAVWRGRAGDLPKTIQLDDSMGMIPSMTLSGQSRWEVVARISATGNATPSPGDLFGIALLESADEPATIVIDSRVE